MKGLKGLRNFKIEVNGLEKSYSITTEEVETAFGYSDLICKMEAKSTVIIDGEYALIKAYIEVYDGVVTHVHIGRDNNHLQLESFLSSINEKDISKTVNELIEDIRYMASNYIGEKDINFAYSLLSMILNLSSYDSNTCLYNEETYSLAQIA